MCNYLSGFKFSIWLGWITGVIFTKNPITFPPFKSWKSSYSALAICLASCMALFATDFVMNVIDAKFMEITQGNLNQLSAKLAQGFLLVSVAEPTFLRVYLIINAKKMSSFFKDIQNRSSRAAGHKGNSESWRRSSFFAVVRFCARNIGSSKILIDCSRDEP